MNDNNENQSGGSSPSYEVGYGKPPKHTRFKPGQSGNPRGRPKGTKNLKGDLIEELRETVTIREGDKSRKVSKQRAIVKALVAKTVKGDARTAALLTSMMFRLLDTGEGAAEVDTPLAEEEIEILKEFLEREGSNNQADADPERGEGENEETPS